MAYKLETNRKGFTFTWILENFEYCWQKTGKFLTSPTFIVDTIERSKWSLSFYPKGDESEDWIGLDLYREKDSKGPATIEVDYELAILATDGSVLTSEKIYGHPFIKDRGHGFPEFVERLSVFEKLSIFLPQGALTIQCKIWKSIGEIQKDVQCIARTRISVERKNFLWKIQNFANFDFWQEKTFILKSTSDDKPIMSLNLFLCKNNNSYTIHIKFVQCNKSVLFSTFKSSLIDANGDYVNCGKHEFWFSPSVQSEICMLSLTKGTLMSDTGLYLPNDILTLYCELAFTSGTVSKGIESTCYGCSGTLMINSVVPENIKTVTAKKSYSNSPSDLNTNLSSMLHENVLCNVELCTNTSSDLKTDLSSMLHGNILCDVKLCTKSETFPAHWLILSARSPVFRAMFQSDMKERAKNQIDIEDLKPDTVRRMLSYMYTDSLDELKWETAADLYVAAEKYQIMALKDKCSSFLKTNLSLTNACEILLLADSHQDEELKSIVQDFILENDIINSSEWKLLMAANLNLAAETMLLGYKK